MQLFGPAYRDAGRIDPDARSAGRAAPARGRLPDDPVADRRRSSRAEQATLDVLRPLRAGSPRSVERRRSRADRSRSRQRCGDFVPRPASACARRCAASCRTRRRSSRGRSTTPRSPSAIPSARTRSGGTGGSLSFFVPDGAHNRHVVLRDKERIARAPPRHAPAHRPGHAARRDDAVRDLLDARRLRRAAHDRQHLVPQALLGLARSLQHHARERPAHPGRGRRRLAAARGALRLRDGPQRLPLDLPPRGAHRHRAGGRLGRRPGDAVAHRGRGRALPLPGLRPPRPRRARARPCRARRDRRRRASGSPSAPTRPRSGASAIRTRSIISSPARPTRSRRSAATSCSTPMASRAAAATWRCGRSRRTRSASPSSAR